VNYDRIDVLEKGTVWQGGHVDEAIDAPPFVGPLLVVCMNKGEDDTPFINHENVEGVLSVWIRDMPDACLKDNVLIGLADMIVEWLEDGGNVYLHCHTGMSRATYIDIAVHCRATDLSADEAYALIKAQRPIADPNPGFMAQLQRLFPAPDPSACAGTGRAIVMDAAGRPVCPVCSGHVDVGDTIHVPKHEPLPPPPPPTPPRRVDSLPEAADDGPRRLGDLLP